MIIDTHSHLSFKAYDNDREGVMKRTREHDVVCIDVGTKYETSRRAVELAQKNENIFAAIGMHPIHIKTDLLKIKMDENEGGFAPLGEEFDKEKYKALAKSKKVVAIGEIGLDYYYKPKTTGRLNAFKEKQKQVFIEQLEMAQELNLPVIIHCRMAHQDLIDIISGFRLHGVVHCFTGSIEEMKQYLDLGFHIGFNGIIFKLNLDEAVKQCPLTRILVETDCPYLTPPAEGDKRNEPVFIRYVIEKIAKIKNMRYNEVEEITFKNAKKLFNI